MEGLWTALSQDVISARAQEGNTWAFSILFRMVLTFEINFTNFQLCSIAVLKCLASGPSVEKRHTASGAAYLRFSLLFWGNATVTVQCDTRFSDTLPLTSGSADPYSVCLEHLEVLERCTVELRPAACLDCGVYKKWNVSVIPGLVCYTCTLIS